MNYSTLRRRGLAFWEVVLVLGMLGLLAAIFFPVFERRPDGNKRGCPLNLKQIMLGVRQYVQDYDERFPLVASGAKPNSGKAGDFSAFGWADALQLYLKSTQWFQCPSKINGAQSRKANPTKPQYTDYWFNSRLSRLEDRKILEPAYTINLGDGTDVTDARYHLMSLPAKWRSDEKSPLYRHLEGANFAFADGHVKWFKASGWDNDISYRTAYNSITFLLGSGK